MRLDHVSFKGKESEARYDGYYICRCILESLGVQRRQLLGPLSMTMPW